MRASGDPASAVLRRRLVRQLPVLAVAAGLAVAAARPAGAARRDWIGSAACGSCHPAQLEAWQRTAHARRFVVGARPGQARCLTCHATGEWPAGPVTEAVVGCEACHGAGADYAFDDLMRNPRVARDLGLVALEAPGARAAVCGTCHARVSLGAVDLARPAHPAVVPAVAPAVTPASQRAP